MNQGRIWCVVNPTVGLPLFLGSVAITSLIVHYSVLSNTTWFASYWNGHSKAKVAAVEAPAPVALNGSGGAQGVVISMTPVADQSGTGAQSFVITVGAKADAAPASTQAETASVQAPVSLALAK